MIPKYDTLSDSAFERLTKGAETGDDVTDILAYEAGINMVAVQFLKDYEELPPTDKQEAQRLWTTLGEMQEAYPETFNKMWQYPLVTARWRKFMDSIDDNGDVDSQVWQEALLELGSITGALAIQCGKPFKGAVAIHDNLCVLPTLGAITLQSHGGEAYLNVADGEAALYHDDEEGNLYKVYLPPSDKLDSESSIWSPLRKFAYTDIIDPEISITIDDLDPYRACFGEDAIRDRLPPNEADLWQLSLGRAINELVSGNQFREPYPSETIEAMLQGVHTLVPLKPLGTRMATSTSIDAVGAIGLSRAPDTSILGEAMVHEYQHVRLTGLFNQHQLFEPASSEPVHYAPWRGDARPILGLLHGLYASVGIMDYWQRQIKPDGNMPLDKWKAFHYSVWAHRVKTALPTLQNNLIATESGQQIFHYLEERVASIDTLPPTSIHAPIAIMEHALLWRLDNCHPDPAAIKALANGFLRGWTYPLSLYELQPSTVQPSQTTPNHLQQLLFEHCFNSFYFLSPEERLSTSRESKLDVDPAGRLGLHPPPHERFSGADYALISEYPSSKAAQELYRKLLQTSEASARRPLWTGYLLALDIDNAISDSLLKAPELSYHLYEALVEYRNDIDPQEVIAWLNRIAMSE